MSFALSTNALGIFGALPTKHTQLDNQNIWKLIMAYSDEVIIIHTLHIYVFVGTLVLARLY